MESCQSWSKEHDWKSCNGDKPFEGSNPLLSAKKIDNLRQKVVDFFIQSEGLACNRRQAHVIRLPCKR